MSSTTKTNVPMSALARFSYKFLAKMCPINLAMRTIMMVCVYSALAYDAKNLPSRQGVKFEPSTFLQVRTHFPPTPNFCEHSDVAVHSDDVRRYVNHHLEAFAFAFAF